MSSTISVLFEELKNVISKHSNTNKEKEEVNIYHDVDNVSSINRCIEILQILQKEVQSEDEEQNDLNNSNDNNVDKKVVPSTTSSTTIKKNDTKRTSIQRCDLFMKKISCVPDDSITSIDTNLGIIDNNALERTIYRIVQYIHILDCAQRTFRSMKRNAPKIINTITTATTTTPDRRQSIESALTLTKQIGRILVQMEEYVKQQQEKQQRNNKSNSNKKQTNCPPITPSNQDSNSTGIQNSSKNNNKLGSAHEIIDYPKTVTEYCNRLKKYQKEIYKNPPVLPPNNIIIEDEYMSIPIRDKETQRLFFEPCTNQKINGGKDIQQYFDKFQPNTTPEEILRYGSFGGTYYRPIHSAVTNCLYNNTDIVLQTSIDMNWITGLDRARYIDSPTYHESVNMYKVKCGGSLGMWESSGWISPIDPYGWFQWYCRFYQGRRTSDDVRQIQRWISLAKPGSGRFVGQLCNKIITACPLPTQINNRAISPVIRQTLLHWGVIITSDIIQEHIKCKNDKLKKK